MKNFSKLFGIIALLAVVFAVSSCVTNTSIGASAEVHGLISKGGMLADEGEEIASFTVWFNLVDVGFEDYAAAVEEAVAAGRQVNTVTTWLFIMSTTRAYAK